MSLLRKISACMLAVIILSILFTGLKTAYAEEIYPLEHGETIIEETLIDENHAEIFTQIDEVMYVKKLQRDEGQWIVKSAEAIQLRGTGLKIKESDKKGKKMLATALESELGSYGLEAASLPPAIDYSHSEFLPTIGNQGRRNSCVGWATGYYLRTYQQARDIGWEVKASGNRIDSHVFSPTFIYNQIRQVTPNPFDEDDGGAYIDEAADLLVEMGAATLADFPYSTNNIIVMPNDAEKLKASPRKIRQGTLLYADANTDHYIIEQTKAYLYTTGDLVVTGSRIGSEFMQNRYRDPYGNYIIIREDASPFGHAFIVVGYNDNLVTPDGIGAFKLINSWGADWGNEGFSYISYEENNLRGMPGINQLEWNGMDMAGNPMADGFYKFNIIPYKNNAPKPAFSGNFNKVGKVETASAYSVEEVIQHVEIPITFKSDGMMNVKVEYNDTIYDLVTDEAVNAGESKTYKILKEDFDFNRMDLNQVRIIIDIK